MANEETLDPNLNGNVAEETPIEENPNGNGDGKSMPYPAVLVMRIPTGEPGRERVDMMEMNGLDPLAVPTLLRLAATIKEQNLGLSERK